MYLPKINVTARQELITDVFKGYVRRLKVADGFFNDTEGVTLEEYPMLASRKPHGMMGQKENVQGMTGTDKLVYVDAGRLYIGGEAAELPEGVTLSGSGKKQLVGMGAYICIFPDAVYVNTENISDSGYMAERFEAVPGENKILCEPSKADGTIYEDVIEGDSAPENPKNGQYWLDTSGDIHALKVWSETSGMWTSIPTVYTRISYPGIGKNFAQYDGVTIDGLKYSGTVESIAEQADALNGDKVIYSRGDDWIVIQGMIDAMFEASGMMTVSREVPQMDYVVESENRLWGCRYGMQNGKTVNELYACKLGDFKNWRCYMGVSTDSYAVTLGTGGAFTGAITYQAHPTFFKEGAIHKVYGSAPSNYQVVTDEYRGVQSGSSESLAIVGTYLYYKSRTDVCMYDGSAPQGISDSLGDVKYIQATGGAWNGNYLISMMDEDGAWHTFVYDTRLGLWIRDSGQQIKHAASVGEELYCADAGNVLWSAGGTEGEPEWAFEWRVVTGVQGWEYTKKKRVSRYNIRLRMEAGSRAYAYLQYDSDGLWHRAAELKGNGRLYTQHMFVIPRRSDHLQMKIEGMGKVEILSISRILEEMSDL